MKNILRKICLSSIAFFSFAVICNGQDGFRVSGHADGIPTGTLYLITGGGNHIDTLGMSPIVDGDFEFVGKVDDIEVAYLTMEGRSSGIQLILENTDIFIKINKDGVGIEGGEEQTLYFKFSELEDILTDANTVFQQQAESARLRGKEGELEDIRNRFDKLFKETDQKYEALIKDNPNHFITSYVLYNSIPQVPYEIIKERFGFLGPKPKSTIYGRALNDYIIARDKVAVGVIAPDFTVQTPEGNDLSLHKVNGKLKLVEFWASWCQYCRAESSNLINLYRKYQPSGLEIISISMDTDEIAWKRAINEDGMIWINGSDLQGDQSALLPLYFISGLPHTLLLDEDNHIIAKDLRGNELRKKINELLKAK